MNGAPCLLQSTLIATWFAWCCACNVLHGWLQCAASALLHSYAHVHTHYTHMYAACTNVIFRLCTPHLSVQGPVGTNGKTLTHSLFLQACRLHSWKQAQMGENKHVNAHIITHTPNTNGHACMYTSSNMAVCLVSDQLYSKKGFWMIRLQNPKTKSRERLWLWQIRYA